MRIEPDLGAANGKDQLEYEEEYLLELINDLPQLELPSPLNWDNICDILNYDDEKSDDESYDEGDYDLQMDPIDGSNQMNVNEMIDALFDYLNTQGNYHE